jgi:hypothetical protein
VLHCCASQDLQCDVFNRECKNNNIYETVYNQQFYTNKQCRGDEQVGITVTRLAISWDESKQMQNVFYVEVHNRINIHTGYSIV